MKFRILRIPGWTTTRHAGVIIPTCNELGFSEKSTLVFQVQSWQPTDKGFELIWEDIPVVTEKETHNEEKLSG